MDLEKIYKIIEKEPGFRKKQIDKLLFQDLISNWSEASTLPVFLREKLNKEAPIEIPAKKFVSKNKEAEKVLFTLNDGLNVEAVLLRYGERNTVCVSSQVGCPLKCAFCATGKMGFKRNLTISEIIEQVLYFGRRLKDGSRFAPPDGGSLSNNKKLNDNITNIVFMGMGEPFLNYDAVLSSIRILNGKDKFNLGARHISISTSGIIPGIEKFSKENLEVNLAISLHAPNNLLRSKLMPINKEYPIEKLLVAVNNYIDKTGRKVMFEYILLEGVNDSEDDALELANIMKHRLYMVNLIKYNQTFGFKASTIERINKFKRVLSKNGISFTERMSLGGEIFGACGQLAGTGIAH